MFKKIKKFWGLHRQTDRQPVNIAPRGASSRDKRLKQKKAKKAARRRDNGVSRYQGNNRTNRKVYTPIYRREINR